MKHVIGAVEAKQIEAGPRGGFGKVESRMIELALSEYCEMSGDVVSEAYLSVEPECRIRLGVIRS